MVLWDSDVSRSIEMVKKLIWGAFGSKMKREKLCTQKENEKFALEKCPWGLKIKDMGKSLIFHSTPFRGQPSHLNTPKFNF